MTSYELWLFLHIVGAIVWIGGSVAIQVFGVLTKRAGDPALSAAFGRNVAWYGTRVLLPSAVLVLATGVLLTEDGNWPWGEPFILFGLASWAVVAVAGFGYVAREMGKAGMRMATEGPSPELAARVDRLVLIARVLLLVLLAVVFMMTVKLGT